MDKIVDKTYPFTNIFYFISSTKSSTRVTISYDCWVCDLDSKAR